MQKELGKWFLDISKYIATAVVLSSVFKGIDTWVVYVVGLLAVVVITIVGLKLASGNPIWRNRDRNR